MIRVEPIWRDVIPGQSEFRRLHGAAAVLEKFINSHLAQAHRRQQTKAVVTGKIEVQPGAIGGWNIRNPMGDLR